MWPIETLIQRNQEAARLASEGKPTRDAMKNIGIKPVDDTQAGDPANGADPPPVMGYCGVCRELYEFIPGTGVRCPLCNHRFGEP